jgi:hypothetical protein
MGTEIVTAIIAATSAVAGAVLGGLFPWLAQRDKKARDRDSKRIAMLEKEVRARIGLEEAAVEWIVDLKKQARKGLGLSENCVVGRSRKRGFVPKCWKEIWSDDQPLSPLNDKVLGST